MDARVFETDGRDGLHRVVDAARDTGVRCPSCGITTPLGVTHPTVRVRTGSQRATSHVRLMKAPSRGATSGDPGPRSPGRPGQKDGNGCVIERDAELAMAWR